MGDGGMGAVCAASPLDAETATLSKKPAAQGRILLWMECFGNLNLTQEQQPPKNGVSFTRCFTVAARFLNLVYPIGVSFGLRPVRRRELRGAGGESVAHLDTAPRCGEQRSLNAKRRGNRQGSWFPHGRKTIKFRPELSFFLRLTSWPPGACHHGSAGPLPLPRGPPKVPEGAQTR